MKKYLGNYSLVLAHILVAVAVSFVFVLQVHAEDRSTTSDFGFKNPLKADSIEALLVNLLALVSRLGAIVAVFFFIYAGFKYVTAQGNEDKVSEAHNMLKWTAVGTAVLLGAQILAKIVANTVQGVTNLTQ